MEITIISQVVESITKTHQLTSIQPMVLFYYLGIDAVQAIPAIATVGLDQYANMLKTPMLVLDQEALMKIRSAAWLTDMMRWHVKWWCSNASWTVYSRAASWVGTKERTFYNTKCQDVVT